MKNLSFFKSVALSMFMFAALTACQKEEQSNQVDSTPQNPVATTYEAKVMQQTTNVIVSMLNENPELFNDINEAIKSDAVEYMEDRILFADLFRNPQFAKSVDGQAKHTTFSSEFKKHASANIQYIASANETRSTALDADALMQYLVDNNISVYCPFPLEDYAENNRIPAIAANIGEQYEELPGVQFYADGSFDSVMVSQAYADLHPVWLINHEEDYIFNRSRYINPDSLGHAITPPSMEEFNPNPSTKHYEVKISSVYLTDYWGSLSEGDIDLRLCFCSNNPSYSTVEECFLGSFDRIITVQIPRSYVKYAKLGYDKGWFALDCSIENDWTTDELQKYFAAYDYDPKYGVQQEETYNTSYKLSAGDANKIVGGEAGETYGAKITITYKSQDDLIALDNWDRSYIFDKVLKIGDATWLTDDGTTRKTALDGNYMIKPASTLTLAVYCEEY